jgi:intraflagellar transport protein 172
VNKGDYEGAVGVFQRYGAPPQPAVFDLYKRISHEILALDPPRDAALQGLKEVLYKLVSGLEGLPGHSEFEQLLFIVHFITQKIMCSNAGLSDTAAKLAISLVRYCTDVPADKAFHDAGQCAKDMGWNNMAFVFFNRYLDLTEAMEEPEMANMIDNSDFANSDIPFDFPLPEKSQTDEEKSHTEEVRNWVLQVSMDNNTDQSLDTRNCDSCGAGTFSGSLKCHSCATTKRPCIITGFPVLRDSVKCPSCNMVANRSDWNNYVGKVKTCPWCGAVANAMMGGGDFY